MKYSKIIHLWLFLGLFMVFMQVIVGGITRLTESGLSITKWEVISGTIPPVSELDWNIEFEKYKNTPQYKEVNEGMTLSDFKFIYFWEFVHRFWARLMGFVFLIPFIYFYRRGLIDRKLFANLGVVVLFASLAAIFGWIMVASGLIERPWVNAYKLSIHLFIAVCVYVSLLWTYFNTFNIKNVGINIESSLFKSFLGLGVLIGAQLLIGGVLSGMKAAVVYPTWPDMHGSYLPSVLFDFKQWNVENFYNYDKNTFMPTLIHFLHRNLAYLIGIIVIVLSIKLHKYVYNSDNRYVRFLPYILVGVLLLQVLLGIITVLNSKGTVPVLWGVLHQGGALILISVVLFSIFITRIKK